MQGRAPPLCGWRLRSRCRLRCPCHRALPGNRPRDERGRPAVSTRAASGADPGPRTPLGQPRSPACSAPAAPRRPRPTPPRRTPHPAGPPSPRTTCAATRPGPRPARPPEETSHRAGCDASTSPPGERRGELGHARARRQLLRLRRHPPDCRPHVRVRATMALGWLVSSRAAVQGLV
jgi:hypothetical protein